MGNTGFNGKWVYLSGIWLGWKSLQSLIRSHLSHLFAIILGVLVVIRETPELKAMTRNVHLNFIRVYLAIALVLVIGIAIWRVRELLLPRKLKELILTTAISLTVLIMSGVILFGERRIISNTLRSGSLNPQQILVIVFAIGIGILLFSSWVLAITRFFNKHTEVRDVNDQDEELRKAGLKASDRRGKAWRGIVKATAYSAIGCWAVMVSHERADLLGMFRQSELTNFEILVVVITALTVISAVWEIFGNKLSTSPQQRRFVNAVRLLLRELENLTSEDPDVTKKQDPDKLLEAFLNDFLRVTCEALCGKKKVHGCLMLDDRNSAQAKPHLKMFKSSPRSNYPEHLPIPFETDDSVGQTGPAGVARARMEIVYMPIKTLKIGWPFQTIRLTKKSESGGEEKHYVGDMYKPSDVVRGWIEAPDPKMENFTSVLCIPVGRFNARGKFQPLGVLNYSTEAVDPFGEHDFIMGTCFSSILAQAITAIDAKRPPKTAEEVAPHTEARQLPA